MGDISIRAAAKIFTSAQLSALAKGDFTLVEKVSSEYLEEPYRSLRDFYDFVYARLSEDYRAEYFFKNNLVLRRLLGRHSPHTATMLTEFRAGKSKADCVILNGKSTCYEIKTEFDSVSRLEAQLQDYLKLFDETYVVCSERHLESVIHVSPPAVGVLVLTKRNYFRTIRPAAVRNSPLDREMLFKSLRKNEYMELARLISGIVPDVANGKVFAACFEIIANAPEKLLSEGYLSVLKRFRRLDNNFLRVMPNSLKNAVISYQFSPTEINSLIGLFVDKEIPCTAPY